MNHPTEPPNREFNTKEKLGITLFMVKNSLRDLFNQPMPLEKDAVLKQAQGRGNTASRYAGSMSIVEHQQFVNQQLINSPPL